jgi:hypothetical protein
MILNDNDAFGSNIDYQLLDRLLCRMEDSDRQKCGASYDRNRTRGVRNYARICICIVHDGVECYWNVNAYEVKQLLTD